MELPEASGQVPERQRDPQVLQPELPEPQRALPEALLDQEQEPPDFRQD